ncbi:unnamed protein product [Mytilus edulis]|uniref:Uncharacterized protein n=1 Tax=Mytilus edulis TaxID=6550 RepID=A0A8S3QQC9_MYTED|nr:unnamed protein product [Mytilus edulis]
MADTTNFLFSWVNNEEMGPFTNWDTGEPNCMEGTNAEPTPVLLNCHMIKNCVRLQHVSTTSWCHHLHKTSITTEAQTYIVSSTTGAQTTTVATGADAQTTTVASTPDTTVMETTSESTKKQLFTSFTYSVSNQQQPLYHLKLSNNLTRTASTTDDYHNQEETSFKPNTDYIPVEFTMLGTFFVNSTQICSCHLLSNQTNSPGKIGILK